MSKKKVNKKKVVKKVDVEVLEDEKDLDIEEIEELEEKQEKKKKDSKPKKKKTKYEKRKVVMKIVGWIMALAMLFGSLISIFGMLIDFK